MLCPQLRRHIEIETHVFRNTRWYLLHDRTSGKHLRLNARAYSVLARLDGKCSLETIHKHLCASESPDLTSEEMVETISRLQQLGALSGVLNKGAAELVQQYNEQRSSERAKKWFSPLMIRIPLFNPDALLNRSNALFSKLFTKRFLVVWLLVVLGALWGVLQNLDLLSQAFSQNIIKPHNYLLLWLLYPLMKAVHEFAHGVCVKRWGGEVTETGISLLVLTPVPYVDASAATSFKSKYKRMLVSAAGIMTELFLASIAFFIWISSEPGMLNDCAFGVFVIGTLSTVVFNANPLLKFDGYYLLQDWIEIPNLYSRSAQYYRYLSKRYILGIENVLSPVTATGEAKWFIFFGVAAFLYRCFITIIIALFLASKYLIAGVLLGFFALLQQFILPLYRGFRYILNSPETQNQRSRSVKLLIGTSLTLLCLVTLVPMPSSTRAQGVVWVPEQGEIYSPLSGFIHKSEVNPGERVVKGQLLFEIQQPEIAKDITVLENEQKALQIKVALMRKLDPEEFAFLQEDLANNKRALEQLKMLYARRFVHAETNGVFSPQAHQRVSGLYFLQGQLIGHVIDSTQYVVRVAVEEGRSGRIHDGITSARVLLAESLSKRVPATLINEIPAANHTLPSPALGAAGGGGIPIASDDDMGVSTVDSVFHMKLSLPEGTPVFGVGERAYVTLSHKAETLGARWIRTVRQVFLNTLPI